MKRFLPLFLFLITATAVRAQTAESLVKSAIDKQNSGDNEGAVTDCNSALGKDPSNAVILNVRALSKYNLKLYKDAIDDYTRTIRAYPSNAIAYNYRGSAHYYLGEISEAIKDFNTALHIMPKYVSALNNRANAKIKDHEFQAAIADLSTSIAIEPTNAGAYSNRAYAKNMLQKYGEAIADCDKAISVDQKVAASAFRNRAFAEMGLGLYAEGIMDCNRSISLEIDNSKVYYYRGYAYFKLGKYALAVADETQSAELDNGDEAFAPLGDYKDEATRLAKAAALAGKPLPVKQSNIGTATNVQPAAQTVPVTAAVAKAIVPVENTNKAIVNFEWKKPVSDFDNLPNGVLDLPDNNEVSVKIKAKSNIPLDKNKFHLYVNGMDVSNGNKMTVADIQEIAQKGPAGQYNYMYEAKVNVSKDKSTFVLKYDAPGTLPSDTLTVRYTPTDINLHVLSIGTQAPLLKFPEQDARDFADIFSSQKGQGRLFKNVETQVLAGTGATASVINTAVQAWSQKSYGNRDVLMLFISSHGLVDNGKLLITGSNYTATANKKYTTVDFKEEILEPLTSINCKKFIFIDACHSGASVSGAKAISEDVANEINKMAGSDNSITIITSSSSNEQSWEDDGWGNGAFTKAIKEGLSGNKADKDVNGFISIDELFEYIKVRVPNLVTTAGKKDSSGSPVTQTPKISNSRGNVSIFQKI